MKNLPAIRRFQGGFTLIELLVVIGIITLLAAALAPRIIGAREDANRVADQQNLRFHYDNILQYEQRYKRYPRGGGSQFVVDPWVRGLCERTEANFEKYWTPGVTDNHKQTLLEDIGVDEIWKELEDVSSLDTHYAGRAKEHIRGKLLSGKIAWMANDNEQGSAFLDQTIHVLMGDRNIKELLFDPDLKEAGWEGDGVEEAFPVGPDSPIEILQKLEY